MINKHSCIFNSPKFWAGYMKKHTTSLYCMRLTTHVSAILFTHPQENPHIPHPAVCSEILTPKPNLSPTPQHRVCEFTRETSNNNWTDFSSLSFSLSLFFFYFIFFYVPLSASSSSCTTCSDRPACQPQSVSRHTHGCSVIIYLFVESTQRLKHTNA